MSSKKTSFKRLTPRRGCPRPSSLTISFNRSSAGRSTFGQVRWAQRLGSHIHAHLPDFEGVCRNMIKGGSFLILDELFERSNGLRLRDLDWKNVIRIIAAHPTVEFEYDMGLRWCCEIRGELHTKECPGFALTHRESSNSVTMRCDQSASRDMPSEQARSVRPSVS